ncbi:homocysteine S-methyltransferase [Cladorrhinum sp. PSN259]|nr:homocysteine S-methyltransferase [Cladorrhinum sp. PSN259]
MTNKAPIKILDGGLGTTLETKYGVQFSTSTPLWSTHLLVTDEETLLNCHKDFVQAGADIISTATYQVSIDGFAATKTQDLPDGIPSPSIPPYLTSAVSLAFQAISTTASTAGSSSQISLALGPLGATILPSSAEYSGLYPPKYASISSIQEWHHERLQLFARIPAVLLSQISYLAFETIPRLDEIKAIRRVMKKMHRQHSPMLSQTDGSLKKFWICVNFSRDGFTLPDGSTVEEVVNAMLSSDRAEEEEEEEIPWGIGINCTKVDKLPRLVTEFEQAVRKLVDREDETKKLKEWPALVLYPDGTRGEVYNVETKKWEVPEEGESEKKERTPWEVKVAEVVRETRERGQWREILVGGCCRCLPEDIARLRGVLFES